MPDSPDDAVSVRHWGSAAVGALIWLVVYALLVAGSLTGRELSTRTVVPGALPRISAGAPIIGDPGIGLTVAARGLH